MNTQILGTVITGVFSLASALGAIWLKDFLERRRLQTSSTVQPAERAPSPAAVQPPMRTWKTPLLVFIAGLAIGGITRTVHLPWPYEWASVIVMVAIAFWLASTRRRFVGGIWLYQLENLALWSAWAAALSVGRQPFIDDAIFSALILCVFCAVVGIPLVLIGSKRKTKK